MQPIRAKKQTNKLKCIIPMTSYVWISKVHLQAETNNETAHNRMVSGEQQWQSKIHVCLIHHALTSSLHVQQTSPVGKTNKYKKVQSTYSGVHWTEILMFFLWGILSICLCSKNLLQHCCRHNEMSQSLHETTSFAADHWADPNKAKQLFSSFRNHQIQKEAETIIF